MPDIQLGSHTLRSHGAKVARVHMHDWLILLLLIVVEVILNVIEPFHRFVGEDMMTDLKYPLKGNTIPFWGVPIIAIMLPFCVILVYYFIRKDVFDLHQAILGLLFSVLITAVITDAMKDAVGRPRPDFFWRCFPDGKGVYDPVTGDVRCTGLKSVIKEGYKSFPSGHTSGHKSFPSGHTSWSFAGLGYLSLYLSGKIKAFDHKGHVSKLCIIVLPLLAAALVGVSRVDDYWHHWEDVFAGALLGLVVSAFCYRQFFPFPYDNDGWNPYAYVDAMIDPQNNRDATQSTNQHNVQTTDMLVQVVNPTSGQNGDTYPSLSLDSDHISRLEDVELGRK